MRLLAFFFLVCWLGLTLMSCERGVMSFRLVDAGTDVPVECPVKACMTHPNGWEGPHLVYMGDIETAPDCPYGGKPTYVGVDELDAPLECEPCTCGPSTGSCALPSKLTASTAICGGGVPSIDFSAPASWDGTCDQMNPVGPGQAKSLTIEPLTIKQQWCPVLPAPPKRVPPPYWKKTAVVCLGAPWHCDRPEDFCMAAPDPSWRVCLYQKGDLDCPSDNVRGYWPYKYVFYDPIHGIDDQRKCTDCECGEPKGSMCTSLFSVYQDSTCSGPVVFGQVPVSSAMPGPCHDLQPPGGQPMGSKSATWPVYTPGACDALQGVVTGTVTKINPSTLCCAP